jgi:polar amino acid transport system permease protein
VSVGTQPKRTSASGPPAAALARTVKTGPTLALVILGLVLFLPTGVAALRNYMRGRRLRAVDRHDARVALAKARTWAFYSLSLSITFGIIAAVVVVFVANDHAVYRTFFDASVLRPNIVYLVEGFWINAKLFLVGEVAILLWSLLVAIVRELPGAPARPLRMIAAAYTDVFRGLPVLLVLLIVGLGLPRTGLPVVSGLSDFEAALLALTLSYGGYMSEVIRGGIHSVHWSQDAAARSLGMTHLQSLRLVVLPQAIRNTIPPLLNGFISLQKDTALVSVLGVLDAVNRAQAASSYSASLSPYAGVAACYLVLTIPLTRLTDYLAARNRRRTLARG